MKRGYWVTVLIILVVIGVLFFIFDNGIEEKPYGGLKISDVSKEADIRGEAVLCAKILYRGAKDKKMEFISQCLGSCGDYAVDIVHVPRSEIDDQVENQCEDYRNRKVSHFIELDQDGDIVRIE